MSCPLAVLHQSKEGTSPRAVTGKGQCDSLPTWDFRVKKRHFRVNDRVRWMPNPGHTNAAGGFVHEPMEAVRLGTALERKDGDMRFM